MWCLGNGLAAAAAARAMDRVTGGIVVGDEVGDGVVVVVGNVL